MIGTFLETLKALRDLRIPHLIWAAILGGLVVAAYFTVRDVRQSDLMFLTSSIHDLRIAQEATRMADSARFVYFDSQAGARIKKVNSKLSRLYSLHELYYEDIDK